MSVLTFVVIYAFALVYLIEVIRALPGVNVLYHRGVKPFACNLCMTLWLGLICEGGMLVARIRSEGVMELALMFTAGQGIAYVIQNWLDTLLPTQGPPPPGS